VILLYVLFIIICMLVSFFLSACILFPCRINGNQPSSKPVNRASKNNLHHEDAKETSEMSNPKETAAPKANEMYSGKYILKDII